MTNDIHNVLIIGAGVAGLTAQYVLRQHGEDPLVIEKDDAVGGLCRSWTMHGAWFDHGIHATFAKDQFVRDLFESGVPQDVLRAAHDLDHTSLILVSLCLKRRPDWPHDFQSGFFYIYDEEILTPRVYSTDDYRPGEREHYALQAEVYYSRYRPLSMSPSTIMEKTIDQLASIGVISRDDIVETDVRDIRYANVLFTHDIYKDRSKVRDYMSANSIVTAGRFGEWDYLWSDQATLSGRRAAEDTLRAMGRL